LRWASRKPWFWGTIVLYSFLVIPSVVGLIGSSPTPERLETIPFSDAQLVVLLPGAYSFVAIAIGALLLLFQPQVAEILFPAPIRRASVVQSRVRRTLVRTMIGAGLAALAAGLAIGKYFAVSGLLEAARIFAVFAPLVGTMWTAGLLASYGLNRLKERTQATMVLLGLGAVLLSLPSFTLRDGNLWDDPLVVLATTLAIPPTKLLLNFPLETADVLAISLGWVLFAALLFVAHEWPSEVYEDFGGLRMRSHEALSRERAPRSEILRRIALRLRARYRDVGSGMWAVVGRNLTASLRFPYVLFNVFWAGIILFAVGPLGFTAVPGDPDAAGTIVLFGTMLTAMMPIMTISPSTEVPQLETVRLLPLRPSQVIAAYLITGAFIPMALALVVGLLSGFVASSAVLGLLGFGVVASAALASLSWAVLAGTFGMPQSFGDVGLRQGAVGFSPWIIPVLVLVPFEGFPLIDAWGGPSAVLVGGIVIAFNGFLAGMSLASAAVRFARPPRK